MTQQRTQFTLCTSAGPYLCCPLICRAIMFFPRSVLLSPALCPNLLSMSPSIMPIMPRPFRFLCINKIQNNFDPFLRPMQCRPPCLRHNWVHCQESTDTGVEKAFTQVLSLSGNLFCAWPLICFPCKFIKAQNMCKEGCALIWIQLINLFCFFQAMEKVVRNVLRSIVLFSIT